MVSNQNGAGRSFSPWVRSAWTARHLESDEHDEHESLRENVKEHYTKTVEHHPKRFKISQGGLSSPFWEVQNLEMSMKKTCPLYCFRKCLRDYLGTISSCYTDGRDLLQPCHTLSKSRCVPSFAPQVLMPPVEKPSPTPFLVNAWRSNHSQWMLCTYPTLSLRTIDGPQKTPFNLCAWLPDESGSDVTAATAELGDIPASKSLTEVMNISAPERLK